VNNGETNVHTEFLCGKRLENWEGTVETTTKRVVHKLAMGM